MHGLTVSRPPPGVAVRPLAEAPAGSRTVEAVLPAGGAPPSADALLGHLVRAALGLPR
jgi:hypothetical protein